MEAQGNVISTLKENQAKSRKMKQVKQQGLLSRIPGRLAKNAFLAASLLSSGPRSEEQTPNTSWQREIAAEQAEQSEAEQREALNATRAEAASKQSTIGFDTNVQRLADAGNIPDARMEEASARVADMTQQMREATTQAQVQALRLEYRQLQNELTEEGLEDQQQKLMDEARATMSRLIVDGGPLMDDALGGLDFGIGTMAADTVSGWQLLYGRSLRGNPEPDRLRKFFIPPPIRTIPAENDPQGLSIYKRAMVWWDMTTTALLWFGQNGLIITIVLFNIIVLYLFYTCWLGPESIVRSGTDSVCIQFAGVVAKTVSTLGSQ